MDIIFFLQFRKLQIKMENLFLMLNSKQKNTESNSYVIQIVTYILKATIVTNAPEFVSIPSSFLPCTGNNLLPEWLMHQGDLNKIEVKVKRTLEWNWSTRSIDSSCYNVQSCTTNWHIMID